MIQLRALLDYVKRYPELAAPLSDWSAPPVDPQKASTLMDARRVEFNGMMKRLAVRLIPAILRQSDGVREACGEAIASIAPVEAQATGFVPAK